MKLPEGRDLENENTNETQKPAFLVGSVIGIHCSRHKPKQLGYLQWHEWAEKKSNEVQSKSNVQNAKDGIFGRSFSIAANVLRLYLVADLKP